MSTVDMSADAVTARLREASRLRRTTIDLMRLGVASNIMNGVIEFVPATSTDDAAQFENEGTHVLCVDLGFAKARRSCGFVADDEDGSELTFADCVGAVVKKLRDWGDECPVALVIEAPLSMRFESGNPVERSFEARDGKHRGWYCNAGGGLYLGAQVFLRRLRQERRPL